MELIKIKELYFTYDKKNMIIKGINISFLRSKFYVVAGPNGSGKTTLLRLIAGIYKNYSGSIRIEKDGRYYEVKNIDRSFISSLITYIPSYIYTPFNFSVKDIILMGRRRFKGFWDYYNSIDFDLVNYFSQYVGISHILNKSFNEISSGERQLVLLAQGLIQDTPIILIDEPTSHLDPKHKIAIMNILKDLVLYKNKTIITIMHDIKLGDLRSEHHIVFMKDGNVVLETDYKHIQNSIPEIAHVYDISIEDVKSLL